MPLEGLCDWPAAGRNQLVVLSTLVPPKPLSRECAGLAKGIFFGIRGLNWMAGCLAEVYAGPLVAPFGLLVYPISDRSPLE